MSRFEDLPYRPCAGIAVFNGKGRVFVGRRVDGPEHTDATHVWQMPQGGIDKGEDPYPAALRELYEETGVTSTAYLGETEDWLTYEFPSYGGPAVNLSRFRGQRQKWFAFAFTGVESEIAVTVQHTLEEAEFAEWRWERLARLPELVVPFKRQVYERVAQEFSRFAA